MTFTKTTFDTVTMLPRWSPAEANKVGTELEYLDGAVYNPNLLINGNFDVWQRGTSFVANYGDLADRWYFLADGAYTVTKQTATPPTGSQNYIRINRQAGRAGTYVAFLYRGIETKDAIKLAGKEVTLSFYARKGSAYSASTLSSQIKTGTGTDENFVSSTAYPTGPVSYGQNFTVNSTWTYVTHTVTLETTVTEASIQIWMILNGTAGANDYIDIAQMKLEYGSTATTFAPKPYDEELRACQRYFQRFNETGQQYRYIGNGFAWNANYGVAAVHLPVTMRVTPALTQVSTMQVYDVAASHTATVTLGTQSGTTHMRLNIQTSDSLTVGHGFMLECTTTGSDLFLDAEL